MTAEKKNWQPRHTRLLLVLGVLAGVGLAATLTLAALREQVTYFYSPSDLLEKRALLLQQDKNIRLGGLVESGSVKQDGLALSFSVTDTMNSAVIHYRGLPPDLFREGQGVVAEGKLGADGGFTAHTLLAKHDEKYMPPEIAKSIKKQEMKLREGTP